MSNILLVEPPKSKSYYTKYPPLGLLKLAALHKQKGDKVQLIRGLSNSKFIPDKIFITSLFTYAYQPVHNAISFYMNKYKKSTITVGGIYATLCSDHLNESFQNRIIVHQGVMPEAEDILPDYSLVPEFKASIVFSTRGCINSCHYCSVPVLEPKFECKKSVSHLIHPNHKKVIFWDNNFLASIYRDDIFVQLKDMNLVVDFNQGLDARLITEEIAYNLSDLRIPILRMAYDILDVKNDLQKAIEFLKAAGRRGRDILVYVLFNSEDDADTPESFLARVRDLINWNVVVYPMRYQALTPTPKDAFISKNWSKKLIEMIADARRVIGYGGAFPPHDGIKKKFFEANTFEEAFSLYPPKKKHNTSHNTSIK